MEPGARVAPLNARSQPPLRGTPDLSVGHSQFGAGVAVRAALHPVREHLRRPSTATDATTAPQPVETEIRADVIVVRPTGKLDVDQTPALRTALLSALAHAGGPTDVVVDLSRVGFCDSSGLNVLIRAMLAACESGRGLRLAAPCTQVARLLNVTDADKTFEITPTAP